MPSQRSRSRRPPHRWTDFEKRIVLCLISRDVHVIGTPGPNTFKRKISPRKAHEDWSTTGKIHPDFVDAFNKALNGMNSDSTGINDVDHEEVIFMAEMMLSEKRAAMAMMARKPGAPRLTRTVRRAWDRGINFYGTEEEWYDEGRGEAVLREIDERVDGRMKSIVRDMDKNGAWVAIDLEPLAEKTPVGANAGTGQGQGVHASNATDADVDMDLWGSADVTLVAMESTNTYGGQHDDAWGSTTATTAAISQEDNALGSATTTTTPASQGDGGRGAATTTTAPASQDDGAYGAWGATTTTTASISQDSDLWGDAVDTGKNTTESLEPAEKETCAGAASNETPETALTNDWNNLDSTFNDAFPDEHWEEDATMVETFSDANEFFENEPTAMEIDISGLVDNQAYPKTGTMDYDKLGDILDSRINPERRVMLEAQEQEDTETHIATPMGGGKSKTGDNTLKLPFNRLEMLQKKLAT